MKTETTIREKLHSYIDEAPADKIEALFVLLESQFNKVYSSDKINELYARRNRHLNGETKSYTLEESMEAIMAQAARR